ncbi:unnamed protein product [Sphenostylis stenocarpa]|uniref:Uncharacterized protein n=1 Tax=Sphenostylis stenocarpa TaxID=92480 RepID=A0AA86VMY3_9FABA|nr:unnamed protein product [Sphenostylis stenocarpa]
MALQLPYMDAQVDSLRNTFADGYVEQAMFYVNTVDCVTYNRSKRGNFIPWLPGAGLRGAALSRRLFNHL